MDRRERKIPLRTFPRGRGLSASLVPTGAFLWAAPSASAMPRDRLAKRMVDIVLATATLVVLAPLLLVIAALIRLEDRSAPALFRQRRCGYGGREFELLKFRTMVRDADHLKEQLRLAEHRAVAGLPPARRSAGHTPRARYFGGRAPTSCRSSSTCSGAR